MKIIILGAGQVGTSAAEMLAIENYEITLVDTQAEHLRALQDRLDIRTVVGSASYPSILQQAGADDADVVLAVTDRDEINMVACRICRTMFSTPTTIARIRSRDYLRTPEIFGDKGFSVDVRISPESIVTERISRMIEHPGAIQVLDFADGEIQLVGVRAFHDGPLVGQRLKELRRHIPDINTRVAAVFRQGRSIIPSGDTIIEPDDEVFFIAPRSQIRPVMSELRQLGKSGSKIMLVGAGNIGFRLALFLENKGYVVKLIERDPVRAARVSEELQETIVLVGDAADEELLRQENIDTVDVFCSLTDNDEVNILSAMLAKRLGAKRVMPLVNRTAYIDLLDEGMLDMTISPKVETVGVLLTHVRRGDMVSVHALRRGAAEAIEVVVHGDKNTSQVVGKSLREIRLPPGAAFGAVYRDEEVLVARMDLVLESEDHIILFLIDKQYIRDVEKLFQVSALFI